VVLAAEHRLLNDVEKELSEKLVRLQRFAVYPRQLCIFTDALQHKVEFIKHMIVPTRELKNFKRSNQSTMTSKSIFERNSQQKKMKNVGHISHVNAPCLSVNYNFFKITRLEFATAVRFRTDPTSYSQTHTLAKTLHF
jgi:hypothetical protein